MHYIEDEDSRGPSGPLSQSDGWAVFVSGELVRCASCHKALGKVGTDTMIMVRLSRADPGALCLMHRCHKCRAYLEIRQVTTDQEQAA